MTPRYKKLDIPKLIASNQTDESISTESVKGEVLHFQRIITLIYIFAVHSDGFPMHFDRISAEWSILYFSGHRWNFLNCAFLS